MVFVVSCCLFAIRWLLSVVCCWMFVVCGLPVDGVSCSLLTVGCWLLVVGCWLFAVCWLLFVFSGSMLVVLLSVGCWLPIDVRFCCLLSVVHGLLMCVLARGVAVFGSCCWLLAVCSLLLVVWCLWLVFVVRCVLTVVCCLLFVGCGPLCAACGLLCAACLLVGRSLFDGCWLLLV